MAYKNIYDGFWTDPEVKKLEPTEKLLFLYFITNPMANVSGLYYIPKAVIGNETRLKPEVVQMGIEALSKGYPSPSKAWKIVYNEDFEIIFVRKMLKHQNNSSPNVLTHIAKHLQTLHRCPLINDFLAEYSNLNIAPPIPLLNPSDTPSNQVEVEVEVEVVTIKNKNKDINPMSISGEMVDSHLPQNNSQPQGWEDCWKIYPRKKSPKLGKKAYQARLTEGLAPDLLLECTKNYVKLMTRLKWEEQHIMLPSTFYGPNERWKDFEQSEDEKEDDYWKRIERKAEEGRG